VEEFMNMRLPTHWRTLRGLSDLRKYLGDASMQAMYGCVISEIVWPREPHPSDIRGPEELARKMGITLMTPPVGSSRELEMAWLLPKISGKFLWMVPGGTTVESTLTAMSLRRVIGHMEQNPKRAFYSDGSMSIIFRVDALRNVVRAGHRLSA